MVPVRPRPLILIRLCQVTNEEEKLRNTIDETPAQKNPLKDYSNQGLVAQRLKRLSSKQEIGGSSPPKTSHFNPTLSSYQREKNS